MSRRSRRREAEAQRPWQRGPRLGVDVGSVRVGLAVCDPDGLVASALETLRRDDAPHGGEPPADMARIAEEARERGVVEIVVGLPRSLDGSEGRAAQTARRYAGHLADVVVPVPVRLVDERLSTVGAHRVLHDGGMRGRQHRTVVDQVAAAWILQTALDSERSSGRAPGQPVPPAGQVPELGGDLGRQDRGRGTTAPDDASVRRTGGTSA